MGHALQVGPADGPAPSAAAVPPLLERLDAFRSLGVNCEFGFVQRYAGAEPSGLFRFSYTPLPDLIHALDTDFSAYGAPGDLHLEETGSGHYYCRSRRYNIWSNTAQAVGSIDPAALLEREYGRIAHLRRRMLADLADGSRILVRKVGAEEDPDAFARLSRAVWRHGPSTLLRVVAAGPGWRPQPVRRIAERVLEGSVRRFAPQERAWELDLEPWLSLCEGAYALHRGLPEAALAGAPAPPALPVPTGLRRHRGRHRVAGLSTFARTVDPARLDPEAVYVFSSWVWIPADFAGTRLFALAGRDRLGFADADLALRERWQRVWAAGRFRAGTARAPVGLGIVGDRSDRFWSWGGRFQAGPVPAPAEPPAVVVAPSFLGWLGRWRR